MRVSYSGYYATLPWSREGFDSPYPLTNKGSPKGLFFVKFIIKLLCYNKVQ